MQVKENLHNIRQSVILWCYYNPGSTPVFRGENEAFWLREANYNRIENKSEYEQSTCRIIAKEEIKDE